MSDIAIRFVNGSTTIDFESIEAPKSVLSVVQAHDLFRTYRFGYYGIYLLGNSYKKLSVDFNLCYSTTIDKIDSIYDMVDSNKQPQPILCYYRYGIDTTTYGIVVQMDRSMMRWPYIFGEKAAKEILTINFYESRPAGMGVLRTMPMTGKGA